MFCPKCGSENLDTSKFCKKCGRNLPDVEKIRQTGNLQLMPLNLLGQILDGKYRIESKLGSGGMGDVYRATRLLIGDSVAIKILHSHLAQDAQAAERFRREAVTATQLKHRNVVGLFDVGISTVYKVPYILMELAEGFSLRQIINQYRILPIDFIVTVTVQLCSALEEAHRLGIVHRDIKPENIIANQTPNGWQVKILDFGIAKLYNQTDIGLTQDGSAMGTPQYMSPEQCMGEQVDGRSDIYSVGILVYEMLAGRTPFKAPSVSAVAIQQVQEIPPPPHTFNLNVPSEIEKVVLSALEKNPELRPQTASQFAQQMIQAANSVVKSQTANISVGQISAPEVKPEFEIDNNREIVKEESHTLSSEILVEKEKKSTKSAKKLKIGEKKEEKTEILPNEHFRK
jgi:serine/threonine-protein kinase